ncbi:MAG TPA: histidinol dehydrogenase, partial [Gammaproteobacteria bacterium]|nr:histidinol dehydrogenase [Gammaproteobacteria bacterium]
MPNITTLDYNDDDFYARLDEMLAWEAGIDGEVAKIVADILSDVKQRGNEAVIEYTNKFDRMRLTDAAQMELGQEQLQQALDAIPAEQREALEKAAERIRSYAEHQKLASWSYTEEDGTVLGQSVNPMDRVGLYVPGGKAAYPSSVLMNAVPA